jgi:hypothetical protein
VQSISCNDEPESNICDIYVNDIRSSHFDEEMLLASSSVNQYDVHSVVPDWKSFAPHGLKQLSVEGRYSTGKTSMSQSMKMAMGRQEGSGAETYTARSGNTQPDPTQPMPRAMTRVGTPAIKQLSKTSHRGGAAKLYHV